MPRTTRRLIAPIQTTLANACRRAPEDPAIFRGVLTELGVVPLLELLERSQCTGRLVLTRGYTSLKLDWIHGRIVADGARHVLEIASGWQDGTFELLPVSFDGRHKTYSVAELVIDLAYEADERARHPFAQTARG